MSLEAYICSNIGGRNENQDCVDYDIAENRGIFVLCDGMGGIGGGKQAAEIVRKTVMGGWDQLLNDSEPDYKLWLSDIIAKANRELLSLQEKSGGKMKTTVCILIITAREAYYANVGDSRILYVNSGKIVQLSVDHSLSYQKFLAGKISRRQISLDPDRSGLLRCVGDPDRCIPNLESISLPRSHRAFLLCSDGFWENLYEEEMLIDSLKSASPRDWAEHLLMRLMPRLKADSDNLSVITVFAD